MFSYVQEVSYKSMSKVLFYPYKVHDSKYAISPYGEIYASATRRTKGERSSSRLLPR